MAVFKYKTYDSAGKITSGVLDADNYRQALSKLKSRGLYPFELVEETPAGKKGEKYAGGQGRVKAAEITVFTRQLASLVTSGMPLVEALTALSEQAANAVLKRIIVDVKERVSSGSSFSDALSIYDRSFPPLYVNLVRAGESSGNLDEILKELADLGEKQEAMRGKILAAVAYPAFMTLVGIIVMAVLFILVIPKIITIFENVGQSLPWPTRLLVAVTEFIQGRWIWIMAFTILIIFLTFRFYGTERGRAYFDRLALKLPLVGGLIAKVEVSRFSRTLSLLLKGGVPVIQALGIVGNIVTNSAISRSVAEAKENVSEGGDISSLLKSGGVFPPVAVHMIAVGERSGKLEDMLLNVAESFDREIEAVIGGLMSILEPLLIVVMGCVIGFIALAVLLPIFEMNMLVG